MIPNCIRAGLLLLALAGCATVSTEVTLLDPAAQLPPPSGHVKILLERPKRPYAELALIEARGVAGESEGTLLEAVRRKAEKLGADAVVRLSVDAMVTPPVAVYDPWPSPFLPHYYWMGGAPLFHPPYFGGYRLVGGGTELRVTGLAIHYTSAP